MKKEFDEVWVRLPESVVEARGGVIPSDETDSDPPPNGLAVTELLKWYQGLPVLFKSREGRVQLAGRARKDR